MHKIRINLVTQSDIEKFVSIARTIEEDVSLIDDANHCVNAKSILGCMYSVEFDKTWITSDSDKLADKFRDFVF